MGNFFTNTTELEKTVDTNIPYKYLVFSGGGIKGLSFCGAVDELEKKGILKNITHFAGTSVGSIIASLLAVGFTSQELIDTLTELDFSDIASKSYDVLKDVYEIIENYGLSDGIYMHEFMGKLIEQKTGNKDYTLKQLYDDKQIVLVINSTSLTRGRSVYFYAQNPIKEYSDIPIRLAVRMSMNIPFLIQPYLYNNELFVDGGVLNNYMITIFDGEFPGDIEANMNLDKPNEQVLGLKIMTNDQDINYQIMKKQDIKNIVDYSTLFITVLCLTNERRNMTKAYWKRTVNIITPDYPLSKFDLTVKEKQDLINNGRISINKKLNN